MSVDNNNFAELIMYSFYSKLGDNDATLNPKQKELCHCVRYEVLNTNNNNVKQVELMKCNRPVQEGTHFCEDHQDCLGFLGKYLSGYEPAYQPNGWSNPYIQGSHNCYAYFLDDRKKSLAAKCEEFCLKKNEKGCPQTNDVCQDLIPQPGNFNELNKVGNLNNIERKYTCPNMVVKILADNPEIKPARLLEKCPANFYKGAMVIDTGSTFHFYRQNPDGTWSHKPGILPVSNVDADNNPIYIPHFANRNYAESGEQDGIKYDGFCGYFCIPTNNIVDTNIS